MAAMNTATGTPEVGRPFKEVMLEQGRKLTWLAAQTGVSYPIVTHYWQGRQRPPQAWLDQVTELLGVKVR